MITSCEKSKDPDLAEVLKGECFWDMTEKENVIGGLNSCYRFLSNGKCYFYYYNFYDKKRTNTVYKFDDDDVSVPETWSTEGDTVIIARGANYKVISFSDSQIVVEGYLKDTMSFIKNCETVLGH
jgi:hypothetical protein